MYLMNWTPLNITSKRFLGVDIGTSAVRLVELSGGKERQRLENYGEIPASAIYEKPFRTFDKNTLLFSTQEVGRAISAVMQEAEIKTKKAIFSIPDFSSFFTNIELPAMTKEELPQAVEFEARQYVPLPLSEVTIDWQIIEGKPSGPKDKKIKLLLVAVPNEVINQYQEIAKIAQLEMISLEAEVFGIARAMTKGQKISAILVDIGAQSTTCSLVDKGILKKSYSLDVSANELTSILARSLSVDYNVAEGLKAKYGLEFQESFSSDPNKSIRTIILPLIDTVLSEVEKISSSFYQNEGREIQKIILTGGTALIPGLKNYFEENLKKEIEISNPFSNIFYPPILEKTLKEIGPLYTIAVGMALRGLD